MHNLQYTVSALHIELHIIYNVFNVLYIGVLISNKPPLIDRRKPLGFRLIQQFTKLAIRNQFLYTTEHFGTENISHFETFRNRKQNATEELSQLKNFRN